MTDVQVASAATSQASGDYLDGSAPPGGEPVRSLPTLDESQVDRTIRVGADQGLKYKKCHGA